MKVGIDADVVVHLIARVSPERHETTRVCYQEHRRAGDEFIIPENVLLEAFSVLSRSPKPVGASPSDALRLLELNFGDAITVPIRSGLAWDALHHTLGRGFAGSRVFDAAIALAAYEAGARLLLTWNVRHFVSIAPVGLEVREPSSGSAR